MHTLADKACLHKILEIMSYDIIDIGHYHPRGQQIPHGIQMSAEEEFTAEIRIVDRRILAKVDDIGIFKNLREAIKQLTVQIISRLPVSRRSVPGSFLLIGQNSPEQSCRRR